MTTRVEAAPAAVTRAIPDWLVVVVGYGVSRVLTTGFLAALFAMTQHWSAAHFDGGPGFLGFLQSWDARWYERIVVEGYPVHIPEDAHGDAAKNPWAFLPLFPLIVRAVTLVSGVPAGAVGILVAAVFGLAAALALHRLLSVRFGATPALWGALFFCFGPLSFVLQVGYADSLYIFLVFLALLAFVRRRYLLAIPFGVLASFAHPGALALAAALGIVGLVRLARRDNVTRHELVSGTAAILAITVAGFAWPAIAAAVTGDPGAYFSAEMAWWRDYLERPHFVPFTPTFVFAEHYLGFAGVLLAVAVIGGLAWLLLRSSRVLGLELWAHSASYLAYLVAVFLPQQSIFRMLLPLSPALGAPALTATPRRRWSVLVTGIALQPVAILLLWVIYPP